MSQKTNDKAINQDPLKRKLEDLIKKKSEENEALKKLLEGLNCAESSSKKENK